MRALHLDPGTAEGEKPTLESLPAHQLESGTVPLGACYILNPTPEDGASLVRHDLSPVRAALAFVQFSKLGALLGGSEAPVVLDRAVTLAGAVPAYVVDVPRDLRRLDGVAEQLIRWHRRVPSPNAAPTT
jgi:hypothetical protein